MSESTAYAPGELDLLAFAEAWAAYCQEQKLEWPSPKIVVEDGVAIARFQEQRVSVRHADDVELIGREFCWCMDEAEARWLPVVMFELSVNDFCARMAKVLDRRIPW